MFAQPMIDSVRISAPVAQPPRVSAWDFRAGSILPIHEMLANRCGMDHPLTQLHQSLETDLLAEMRVSEQAWAGRRTKPELLEAYHEAHKTLRSAIDGAQKVVHELIEATLQYEGFDKLAEQHSAARSRMWELLRDFRDVSFMPPRMRRLDLALVELPIPDMARQLCESLRHGVERFLKEFLRVLLNLKERGVVGYVKRARTGEPFCEFSYFRSLAKNRRLSVAERALGQVTGGLRRRHGNWERKRVTTTETKHSGEYTIQHVFHEYLLSSVCTQALDSAAWELPARIKPVTWAMPTFLRRHTSVISGQIQSGRVIAKDIATFAWEYTTQSVREEWVRHFDPGLVLGNYFVLCGWCPKERPLWRKTWEAAQRGVTRSAAAGKRIAAASISAAQFAKQAADYVAKWQSEQPVNRQGEVRDA